MLCLRCARSALQPLGQALKSNTPARIPASKQTTRSLSQLTSLPTRPILPQQSRATQAFSEDKPTSSLLQPHAPAAQPLQVRTAIRDTYNPSHRVRKRRHGFLSRLRTRTGRKTIKRRKAKGRNTLSH